ncbi:MAG: carboxysome shell carbonic anhydrase [Sedimenticolaceae bacterium]
MLRSIPSRQNTVNRAPSRRPSATASVSLRRGSGAGAMHALVRDRDNARLADYEQQVKSSFDEIVPTLKRISALQHESDFVAQAQRIARAELGFELPADALEDAWVDQLDMRRLFAWAVFETYRRYCDDFYSQNPLASSDDDDFDAFLQSCGFHTLDVTPCADGRLAHVIRYVLRLPQSAVRRKSYAGATFDVEDSIQKWTKVEMLRHREAKPNSADEPTHYLKVVAYHFSSVDPLHQGCAAHGSDTDVAAKAGLQRLESFREAIESSFCCGASIDLLLMGVDTDTDALRIHVPDQNGNIDLDRSIDTLSLYEETAGANASQAIDVINAVITECNETVQSGMQKFVARLIENNFSQIAYVKQQHGGHYPDIGHAERFIGAGVGFEEVQLRNLMYFSYLDTVEEATADLDVGVKIFSGLNVAHGLPIPFVIRFDYHGQVPGARDRAQQHCARVTGALKQRYKDLVDRGLLHVMQVARDLHKGGALDVFGCTADAQLVGGH